jgi:hypothetical protein
MWLLAIYILPGSVPIFPAAEKANQSWEYINRSHAHERGNWDFGRAIPVLGTFVSNFQYWFLAVWVLSATSGPDWATAAAAIETPQTAVATAAGSAETFLSFLHLLVLRADLHLNIFFEEKQKED